MYLFNIHTYMYIGLVHYCWFTIEKNIYVYMRKCIVGNLHKTRDLTKLLNVSHLSKLDISSLHFKGQCKIEK